ncbi:hypothetical protein SOVF_197770 [Spinacia oleracea]|nr:hypothetical protein SOVF_197770 [Spinacia oleracea]
MNMAFSTSTPIFSFPPHKNTNNHLSPIFRQKTSIVSGFFPLYKPPTEIKPSFHRSTFTVPAISSSQGFGALVGTETNFSLLDKALVFDLKGNGVPVSDLWKDRKAVVAFARHFGCVLCRKRADYLASKKDNDGIFVSQNKYASDILKKFKMDTTSPIRTPVAERVEMKKEGTGELVKSIVGSLRY